MGNFPLSVILLCVSTIVRYNVGCYLGTRTHTTSCSSSYPPGTLVPPTSGPRPAQPASQPASQLPCSPHLSLSLFLLLLACPHPPCRPSCHFFSSFSSHHHPSLRESPRASLSLSLFPLSPPRLFYSSSFLLVPVGFGFLVFGNPVSSFLFAGLFFPLRLLPCSPRFHRLPPLRLFSSTIGPQPATFETLADLLLCASSPPS